MILHHVEVEADAALLELGGVDTAHTGVNPGAPERPGVGKRQPLLIAVRSENFEGEAPASGAMGQRRALDVPAGLGEQGKGAAQGRAVAAGTVAFRR